MNRRLLLTVNNRDNDNMKPIFIDSDFQNCDFSNYEETGPVTAKDLLSKYTFYVKRYSHALASSEWCICPYIDGVSDGNSSNVIHDKTITLAIQKNNYIDENLVTNKIDIPLCAELYC